MERTAIFWTNSSSLYPTTDEYGGSLSLWGRSVRLTLMDFLTVVVLYSNLLYSIFDVSPFGGYPISEQQRTWLIMERT